MANLVQVELQGLDPFLRRLRRVEKPSKQRSILRSSMNSGLGPIKTEMRKQIRSQGAIRKRNLYRAIFSKVRAYPSGVVILMVGVKDKKTADGENPGKYFHLVDLGTQSHPQTKTPIPERWEGGWIMWGKAPSQHSGAQPKPIREPAAARGGPKVADRVFTAFEKKLRKEFL